MPTRRFRLRIPVCVLLSAALLLSGYSGLRILMHKNSLSVTYLTYEEGQSDYFLLRNGKQAAVIDISGGTRSALNRALAALKQESEIEIDHYLLTSYQTNTQNTICRLLSSEIVRRIYLPTPVVQEQAAVADTISKAAEKNGASVIFYEPKGLLSLGICSVSFHPRYSMDDSAFAFSLYYGQRQLLYLSEGALDYASESLLSRFASLSQAVFLGAHGPTYQNSLPFTANDFTKAPVICGTAVRIPFEDARGCISTEKYQIKISKN